MLICGDAINIGIVQSGLCPLSVGECNATDVNNDVRSVSVDELYERERGSYIKKKKQF